MREGGITVPGYMAPHTGGMEAQGKQPPAVPQRTSHCDGFHPSSICFGGNRASGARWVAVGAYRIRGNRACLRLPSVAEHQTRMGRIMDNYVERHALRSYSWEQRLPGTALVLIYEFPTSIGSVCSLKHI